MPPLEPTIPPREPGTLAEFSRPTTTTTRILPGEMLGTYRLTRRIDAGAMGVVFEALDTERGRVVALKTLESPTPDRLLALKTEFRIRSRLVHPNLIEMYELVADGDVWFFTMALVEGAQLDRATPPWQEEGSSRLRDHVRQLAEGILALHAEGILHLDLKPANIRVSDAGRVVILDFGLARREEDAGRNRGGGTIGYRAPEQEAGMQVGPAADWFAFGVILAELCLGVRLDSRRRAAEQRDWFAEVASRTPSLEQVSDLVRLSQALLDPDPSRRPPGPETLVRLGGASVRPPLWVPLVGRESQERMLAEVLRGVADGGTSCVWIRGPSGIGKSFLLNHFLSTIEPNTIVLRGRCNEREQAPYQGFDQVVDDLADRLGSHPGTGRADFWDMTVLAAAKLFPALAAILPVGFGPVPTLELEPGIHRRLAVSGLRKLVRALAGDRPVVIAIDDVHWSDVDSARLWAGLLAEPFPLPLMLVGCVRSDAVPTSSFHAELDGLRRRDVFVVDEVTVDLDALPTEAAAALAARLLCARGAPFSGDHGDYARQLAEEAGGIPFLIEAMVRYSESADRTSVSELVRDRLLRLPDAAVTMLRRIAICGRPIRLGAILATTLQAEDPAPTLVALHGSGFIRLSGLRDSDQTEIYHDRLRIAILDGVPPVERQSLHRTIAEALERRGDTPPHLLAAHFYGAGLHARAYPYAEQAALHAEETLAFSFASEQYARMLEAHGGDASRRAWLQERRAHCLHATGRVLEAAEAWRDAALLSGPNERTALERKAAEASLLGGRVDEGVGVLAAHARNLGIPVRTSGPMLAISAVWQLLSLALRGTHVSPRHDAPSRAQVEGIDLCWAIGKGLAYVLPLPGIDAILRSLRMALRWGEANRAARALGFLAAGAFHQVRPLRATSLRYLKQARRIADAANDPGLQASIAIWEGMCEIGPGNWNDATARLRTGLEAIEARGVGMHWERLVAAGLLVWIQQHIGDYESARRTAVRYLADAVERGDLYGEVLFRQYVAYGAVSRGEVEAARRHARFVIDEWAGGKFTVPTYYATCIEVLCDLYDGNLAQAESRWTAIQPPFRRAGGNGAPVSRIDNAVCEARILLRLPLTGPRRRRLDRIAARLAGEYRRDGIALAAWIRAAVSPDRDREGAVRLLDRAGLAMHANCLRLAVTSRTGVPDAVARKWLIQQEISNPERWAETFMPIAGAG